MSDDYVSLDWLEGRWKDKRAVVELDIPREWRLWRVYNSPGVQVKWDSKAQSYRLEDPMDGAKFDEATSFPALKPSIDIFGMRPSRKQRGWYQVKPWPPRSPSPPYDSASPLTPAAAADVPPELFECILSAIGRDLRGLVRCGQVCRYWAAQCRPQLFGELKLCSRRDAIDFRGFAKDPACGFLPHVYRLRIFADDDLSKFNWVHVIGTIELLQCGEDNIVMALEGPLPAKMKTFHSIHWALPRSLPQFFSRRICTLRLTDLHFSRFEDLIHLAGELPDLAGLECTKVTWDSLPTTELPHRRPAADHKLATWNVTECSPSWRQAGVFLFRSMHSAASFFSDDDLPRILALLETQQASNETRHEAVVEYYLNQPYIWIYLHLDGYSGLTVRAELRSVPGGSRSFHVTSITVPGPSAQRAQLGPVDWTAFDTLAIKFTFLQTVNFQFEDKESMLCFTEEVGAKQMPALALRGLLRYGMIDRWPTLRIS